MVCFCPPTLLPFHDSAVSLKRASRALPWCERLRISTELVRNHSVEVIFNAYVSVQSTFSEKNSIPNVNEFTSFGSQLVAVNIKNGW